MLKLQLPLISSSAQGPFQPQPLVLPELATTCSQVCQHKHEPLPLQTGWDPSLLGVLCCLRHWDPTQGLDAMDVPSKCCRLRPGVKVGCWTCSASERSIKQRLCLVLKAALFLLSQDSWWQQGLMPIPCTAHSINQPLLPNGTPRSALPTWALVIQAAPRTCSPSAPPWPCTL